MSLQPCAKQPFVGTLQEGIPYSTTNSLINRIIKVGQPYWQLFICSRPAILLYGTKYNADLVYEYLPSNASQSKTILTIAQDALLASKNFTNSIAGNVSYTGEYPDYLARKIAADNCLNVRYEEAYNKPFQFLKLAALGAWNLATYKELTYLTRKMELEVDMQMFLPPGMYEFAPGSNAQAALEAWFAFDPTLNAFYSLEIVTT